MSKWAPLKKRRLPLRNFMARKSTDAPSPSTKRVPWNSAKAAAVVVDTVVAAVVVVAAAETVVIAAVVAAETVAAVVIAVVVTNPQPLI